MEPKGHVYKTPYCVHEGGVMYIFFVESDKAMLFVTPHNFSVTFGPVGENGLAPLNFDLLLNCIQTLLYGTPTPLFTECP
jgi:hypothetical protein